MLSDHIYIRLKRWRIIAQTFFLFSDGLAKNADLSNSQMNPPHKMPGQHPIPARRDRDRLRECQDSNKENSGACSGLVDQFIAELVKEGFDHDVVVRALKITENNMDMTKNILREFVSRK